MTELKNASSKSWAASAIFAMIVFTLDPSYAVASGDDAVRGTENPFAAHNAYPWRLYQPERFERALASGLKHIELDLTYDTNRRAVIVTHDSAPRGGEPALATLLEPLWHKWGAAEGDGYTLILDFKTASPELAHGVHATLEPYAELLSTMPKSGDGDFRPGRITVCLTGSGRCQQMYRDAVPSDDQYLAFGDHGHTNWLEDAAAYVPDKPAGFYRFLTFHFRAFLDGPDARGPDHISPQRMREVVELANERGYRMRIYTINPARRTGGELDDRFWRAAAESGVHMISTDFYEDARDWWAANAPDDGE